MERRIIVKVWKWNCFETRGAIKYYLKHKTFRGVWNIVYFIALVICHFSCFSIQINVSYYHTWRCLWKYQIVNHKLKNDEFFEHESPILGSAKTCSHYTKCRKRILHFICIETLLDNNKTNLSTCNSDYHY